MVIVIGKMMFVFVVLVVMLVLVGCEIVLYGNGGYSCLL